MVSWSGDWKENSMTTGRPKRLKRPPRSRRPRAIKTKPWPPKEFDLPDSFAAIERGRPDPPPKQKPLF